MITAICVILYCCVGGIVGGYCYETYRDSYGLKDPVVAVLVGFTWPAYFLSESGRRLAQKKQKPELPKAEIRK